ncbi:MAG: hypothetical protein Ct9H300mP25_05270 [Acidobacteriota bacterium]|nr:MAG: hypothetical protein Ct9H300mP25_05270 [Acidobacteriota bacterium]
MTIFAATRLATRSKKSDDARKSIGTQITRAKRQAQKATIHSARLSPQIMILSPVVSPAEVNVPKGESQRTERRYMSSGEFGNHRRRRGKSCRIESGLGRNQSAFRVAWKQYDCKRQKIELAIVGSI